MACAGHRARPAAALLQFLHLLILLFLWIGPSPGASVRLRPRRLLLSRNQRLQQVSNLSSLSNQKLEQPANSQPPRVHFLFLAVDKIQRLDVWQRFLERAPKERYTLTLHCKVPAACRVQLDALRRSRGPETALTFTIVDPPTPTQYCTDLVGAENRLLEVALQHPAHPRDKFAFVGDSTLPSKPFLELHSVLTAVDDSRFCIFPQQEWATAPRGDCVDRHTRCEEWANKGECRANKQYMHFNCQKACKVCTDLAKMAGSGKLMAVKTHEWKVLNRGHAERAVHSWHQGYMRHLMQALHLNWHDSFRNTGCLDEFWHFAALFGTFPDSCIGKADSNPRCLEWAHRGECTQNPNFMLYTCQASCTAECQIPFWRFNLTQGSPAYFTLSFAHGADTQGTCDTFVKWNIAGVMGRNNDMVALDRALLGAGNQVVLEPHGQQFRPETILRLSTSGLAALRRSPFLFARKFKASLSVADDCGLVSDAYARLVFDEAGAQVASGTTAAGGWVGEGTWLDSNGESVSVFAQRREPGRVLQITNARRPKWSGKGIHCGETAQITFNNGLKASSYADMTDGNILHWSNGVSWFRDVPWRGDGTWRDTAGHRVVIRTKGGYLATLQNENPEWSGVGELMTQGVRHPGGSDLVATFNAKGKKNKKIKLYGKLSADGNRIDWHNGHYWLRDSNFVPPCVCEPENVMEWGPSEARVPRSGAPPPPNKCIFVDLGVGASAAADLATLKAQGFNTGGFAANTCEVYLLEGDGRYDPDLQSAVSGTPNAFGRALTSTAVYSCTPPGGVVDFYTDSVTAAVQVPGHLRAPAQNVKAANGRAARKIPATNLMRFLREIALPEDHVIVKMDLGGTEWDILPCLARSSSANLVDYLYVRRGDPNQGLFGTTVQEAQDTLQRLGSLGVVVADV